MRREINKIILMAIGMISLSSSCVNENEPGVSSEGEKAFVKIGAATRGPSTGDDLDNEIKSLRIITFRPGGSVTGNEFFDAADPRMADGTITYQMMSGTYDFVFIANENNGVELNALKSDVFTGIKKITDLNNVSIPQALFNQSAVIPMLTEVPNVKVLPGTQGVIVGGSEKKPWIIDMKRLGIRIDMILRSKVDIKEQITAIKFYNVADAVPLRGNYSGGTSTVTRSASEIIEPLEAGEESAEYIWGRKAVRIILPSHMFTDKANAAKALKIELVMGADNPSIILGVNEPTDYTLPPNTNFKGEATIGPLLELHLTPVDWSTQETYGDILGRTLNVSSFKKYLIDASTERIYFNSNQKDLTIETTAVKWNSSANLGEDVTTNNIFDRIAGTGAANLSYTYNTTTGLGTGYVDLTALSSADEGVYKLYFNAGGLRREIKLTLLKTNSTILSPIKNGYVGTFHRWNETDERRITIPATGTVPDSIKGNWMAVVVKGNDWIRLDTEAFGSNSGRVGIGSTSVEGNATASLPIRFRVGLTGNHPLGSDAGTDGNAQPRYGLIYVYYGSNLDKVHPVFVRQGEAADFLMRNSITNPEDNPTGTTTLTNRTRTQAKRFSPYNLTDPNGGTGRVGTVTGTKYSFTNYPSQGGYYFQWYQTWAWSPVGTGATDWISVNSSTAYWKPNETLWETCPEDYRRPNDGSTSANVSPTADMSEIRQSLYLNPQNGATSNSDNSVFGFLADGFFDRGNITDPEGSTKILNTAVSPKTANVAYIGQLFFNPNNKASVFFPASGYHDATDGNLYGVGHYGYYWSSSSSSTSVAWFLCVFPDNASQWSYSKFYGTSLRCIRDE